MMLERTFSTVLFEKRSSRSREPGGEGPACLPRLRTRKCMLERWQLRVVGY
jgi:hypothetical protein